MFRDYLELVIGTNQTINKKAEFITYYLTALSGKSDLRAHEKTVEPYSLPSRGAVADRIREKSYKYDALCRNTYGLSDRRITSKQQRERDD